MDSKRQEKFARQLQKDLGEIFQQNARSLFGGAFITVSGVKVSPDLGYIRCYLSFFQTQDKEALLELIQFHTRDIRHQLAQRVRNQVRKVPELEFFMDDSLDYVMHMEEVFKKLKDERNPEDPGEE